MTTMDVPEVSRVEARCFTNPWPPSAYRRELRLPDQNVYLVARQVSHGAEPSDRPPDANPNGTKGRSRLSLLPFSRKTEPENRIVGFAGMWIVCDEAHITTIGVAPEYRGQGLGEWLLVHLIEEAIARHARWLTLEVRVSNEPAQTLYRKYGFSVQGTRKRYYSDDNEDAYIMWSPSLREQEYVARFHALRQEIASRFVPPPVERASLRASLPGSGT